MKFKFNLVDAILKRGKIKTDQKELLNFLSSKWSFRYNVLLRLIEVAEINSDSPNEFKQMKEFEFAKIVNEVVENGFKIRENDLSLAINSILSFEFNPITELVQSLPEYDGKDHIHEYSKQVRLQRSKDQREFREYFKSWFISHVFQLDGGHNGKMIILSGPQGAGKSLFFNKLLFDKSIMRGVVEYDPDKVHDIDMKYMMSQYFILDLGGVENFKNSSFGKIKDLLSSPYFIIRYPYESNPRKVKRTASLCGTTCNSSFKYNNDSSRRIKAFFIKTIKFNEGIDIRQMYSQALFELSKGYAGA